MLDLGFHAIVSSFGKIDLRRIMMMAATASDVESRYGQVVDD